ncbi:uncharacterized protein LOC107808779 isoform X1 [Nicotiana tabacum]|uniref:Uncharacterized protein LOC107808779 isoform X1 n=1 Tax=Nicotiana tabacum TaxID=4097 RepID=A0AC58UAD0_TOBAC
MEEEKKLARNNRINIRKQKRPKVCSDKNGDGFGKEKKTQPLADITNRQHFPRLNYTPLESCAHASSSQSQAQYPNLPTQQHLQFGLSTSNVQTNFLLPDLNEIPLLPELDDVNIDGDVAEINDATEDEDDYEEAELPNDELKNRCLQKLENLLKGCGRTLYDFPTMPTPVFNEEKVDNTNRLICEELRYNRCSLSKEHEQLLVKLTSEQKLVYDRIIKSVNEDKGGFFFLYGHGGTGKTFIWRTLSSAIRCKGDIVLTVASSGIASLLLLGGRTSHSRFAIPLNATEDSTCNIKQGTPLSKLIVKTKLIIWDEAPMMHRYCFEALDRTLRDILRFKDASNLDRLFGGKTVVLGGDFRQILPVIPKGTRQDIVNVTLNSSYLWNHCQVLKLTKNIRLERNQVDSHLNDLRQFSDWILAIGDGMIGNSVDGIDKVHIPDDLIINNCDDPICRLWKVHIRIF